MDRGLPEEEVLGLIQEMRDKDFRYDRLFSTMCTIPHPIAIRAHDIFVETNLGDPGLFPGVAEVEYRVVRMLGEMLGCPDAVGYVSTGGTESNIQAIRSARNASAIRDGNIVVPESAHFSFDKIGDLLRLEVRKARLDRNLKVDLGSVEELVDDRTVAMVGIAGSTEFGQVDPLPGLAEIALDRGCRLHVDAAFGGFVLPFLKADWRWDFRVEGVTTITVDPHKMGMSTIPAGGLLFRSLQDMKTLETETHYLTVAKQASLTGTRSGAAAAATYAVMMHMGMDGYRKLVGQCMDLTRRLVARAREIGVEPVIEPVLNVVALKVDDPAGVRAALMERDWHVSTTRSPRALRMIIMPHITAENIDLLIRDLDQVLRSAGAGA
ncbi:MAG: tyrosine decarboxylase MfnA [Methanosarcinales archaeon]|nr:tyrosine decarboxylase MfnA [Methanosarcinales archaeon]